MQLKLVYSLSGSQCNSYDTDGNCLSGSVYSWQETQTQQVPQAPPSLPETTQAASSASNAVDSFLSLAIEFLGIVSLFIILVILLESLTESK